MGDGLSQLIRVERDKSGKTRHSVLQPLRLAGTESVDDGNRNYVYWPDRNVLAACALLGIDEVYAAGGAQGIAMLALLAEVDVITGPGNVYVTAAKRLLRGVVGIDSEAGPTEIAIVADETADPDFVAADLISQSADALSRPIAQAANALLTCITSGGKVLVAGGGGAAALAPYAAALWAGRFERQRPALTAIALGTNPTLASLVGDIGEPTQALAKEVQALGAPGDVLVAIAAGRATSSLISASMPPRRHAWWNASTRADRRPSYSPKRSRCNGPVCAITPGLPIAVPT